MSALECKLQSNVKSGVQGDKSIGQALHSAEEETINEINPIGSGDMKSGSEVLRNKNDGQGNYDGMTISFTVCLFFLLALFNSAVSAS